MSWASCAVGVSLEEVTFSLVLKDEEQFTGQRKCQGPSGKGMAGAEAQRPALKDRPGVLSRKLLYARPARQGPGCVPLPARGSLVTPHSLFLPRAAFACISGSPGLSDRGGLCHSCLSSIFPSAASKKQTAQLRKQSITLS